MQHLKHEAKEAAREMAHGVWGAMTTPFTSDGAIDEQRLRDEINYMADELKLVGVTFGAVMGEFWALTREERMRLNEIVVEEARGRIKVMAFSGHHSVQEAIDLTIAIQESDVDATSLVPPYFPQGLSERDIYRYVKDISDATEIGIWIADTGFGKDVQGVATGMSVELTLELAKLPNVVGLKVARGDEHLEALKAAGVGDLIVLTDPDETRLIDLIRRGQSCHIAAPWPYALQTPSEPLMNQYAAAAFDGDFDKAEEISERMQPVRAVFGATARDNPGPIVRWLKPWMDYLGVPGGGPVRSPVTDLEPEKIEALHAAMETVLPKRAFAGSQSSTV